MGLSIKDNHNIQLAMAKIDILSFFQANPHTRDTLEGFSNRLFLKADLVENIMEELVRIEILDKSEKTNCVIYRLKVSYLTMAEQVG